MATIKISKHINYKEGTHSNTATRKRMRNEPNEDQLAAMKMLSKKVFEPLRVHFDTPIRINSFFRSVALNKAIGGSGSSQHCKGEAIDIDATGDTTNKQLFDYIKDNLEFDQLIWEFGTTKNPDWIHVSFTAIRENRKRVLKAVKDGNPVYQVIEEGSEVEQPKEKTKEKRKGKKGIVAVKTLLNVRKTASTDAKVVGQLKNAKKVKIVREENGWYNIKTSKYSGWVSAKYIKLYKKSTGSK